MRRVPLLGAGGERDQGTLEPLLTPPVRRGEILIGKALASFVASVGTAYILFALVMMLADLFACNPTVATTLTEGSHILAQALFAPLLAAWSIGVGTAISARSSDPRTGSWRTRRASRWNRPEDPR